MINKIISKLFFAVIAILLSGIIYGQNKPGKMDDLLNQYNKQGQFNGTVLVAENGKVILEKGYGYANVEWQIPNGPDTKFRVGSIGKQFIAMAIMKLVEEGKVRLDNKISEYLPEFRKDIANRVTVHQLLTHSSGIPWSINYNRFVRDTCSLDETMKRVCSGDLEFEPGTKYKYSSSGFFTAMAVAEKASGIKFSDYLREKVLAPAGMNNTFFESPGMVITKLANGYRKVKDGYDNVSFFNPYNWAVYSSILTTAKDLFLWDQSLYGNRVISNGYRDIIFNKHIKTTSTDPAFIEHYGYGWLIREYPDKSMKNVIRHSGGDIGFSAVIIRYIDNNNTIILLANTNTNVNKIALNLENILYDKPYKIE